MRDAPSTSCQIDATDSGAMAILAPVGELDLAGVDRVLANLDAVLARRPLVVAFDLRRLTFMDVSGVHVLLTAAERCRARGRRFMVIQGGPGARQVDRLLAACGLDAYFELVAGLDDLPEDELLAAV